MPLDEGLLDRRLRIERATIADDGYNEAEAWQELATVWAQYIPAAGREAREQLGRDAQLLASFRVRWSVMMSAVAAGGFRLRYPSAPDGQLWDIKSAVEVGRREGIEILAIARAGATA